MKPLAIIPCAGFGTRMGMKKHESKEMLPDNIFGFDHIIDYSLMICKRFDLEPLVISRKEKKDLNNYLKKKKIKVHLITPQGEWPETVLSSQKFWRDQNILLLPDTRFYPESCIEDILKGLQIGNNAVFALHKVMDPENWGIIKDYSIIEKSDQLIGPENAWGIIGFKSPYGSLLFGLMKYHMPLENVGFVYLNSFQDITRK